MVWVIAVWLVLSALATTWSLAACIVAGRAEQSMQVARGNQRQPVLRAAGSPSHRRAAWHPYAGFPQTRLAVVGQPAVHRNTRKSMSASHRRMPR
jgi:hypothetical protein